MKKKSMLSICITLVLMSLSLFILVNVMTAKARGETPSVLGYSLHTVVTDSMTPLIEPGDFVLARKGAIEQVTETDTVVFKSTDPDLNGKLIVHNVIGIETVGGVVELTTSGIKEGAAPDKYPVTARNYIGKVVYSSAALGKVMVFLSDLGNLLFLALIIAALWGTYKVLRVIWKNKETPEQSPETEVAADARIKAEAEQKLRDQVRAELVREGLIAPDSAPQDKETEQSDQEPFNYSDKS